MWEKYLREQALLHPSMEPADVMKFCFQAAFGAEHLLRDTDAAWRYLQAEYESVSGAEAEPLYECISDSLCRVNLRAWKRKGFPLEWLFAMFVKGAEEAAKVAESENLDFARENVGISGFTVILQQAEALIVEGVFNFTLVDWQEYLRTYPLSHPVAVHHSEAYRAAEKPAYRLAPGKYMRLLQILEALHEAGIWNSEVNQGVAMQETEVYVIAIDGRCASGKTTMAGMLADITGAGVVHMDDFFLPMELRTPERRTEAGGNVHYERVLEEVLPCLKYSDGFSYGRFDCGCMAISGERIVSAGKIRIVEGAYSCHPKLGEYMSLRVFSDVDTETQLARIGVRDGEGALQAYREKWIPMEEAYLEAYDIKNKADIVL